jgi:MoxR-like ATPase
MPQPGNRPLTDRLRRLRDALLDGLVERDEPIRLALLAVLAGEHVLLLGDPGTAKSMVARRLHHAFASGGYFERLLTRFTVPEELFGPLSIQGLEQDRYERVVAGYLPSATVAFLDEVFKANSAILNALLTLLNERLFDNGTRRMVTPLAAVVGASNELPKGEDLSALYDRFLIRLQVAPVSKEGFRALLKLRGATEPSIAEGLALSPADLEAVRVGTSKRCSPTCGNGVPQRSCGCRTDDGARSSSCCRWQRSPTGERRSPSGISGCCSTASGTSPKTGRRCSSGTRNASERRRRWIHRA